MQNYEAQSQSIEAIDTCYEVEFPVGMPMLLNDTTAMLRDDKSPTDLEQAIQILIGTTFRPDVLYADATKFQGEIQGIMQKRLAYADPARTAILLPGTGAQSVRRENFPDSAIFDRFPTYALPTQRIVENGKVKGVTVELPTTLTQALGEGVYTKVVVLEDVVATGKTLNTLREKVSAASSAPVRFEAAAWFCRKPTVVDGYAAVSGVFRYSAREGYPALNSLSTWLRTDWKGLVVRALYKDKYIRYPYGFDKQIREIRKLMKGEIYESS